MDTKKESLCVNRDSQIKCYSPYERERERLKKNRKRKEQTKDETRGCFRYEQEHDHEASESTIPKSRIQQELCFVDLHG